jgi:hypothetical protein
MEVSLILWQTSLIEKSPTHARKETVKSAKKVDQGFEPDPNTQKYVALPPQSNK